MTRAFRDTHEMRMAADPEYAAAYMALLRETEAVLGQCSADTAQEGELQTSTSQTVGAVSNTGTGAV